MSGTSVLHAGQLSALDLGTTRFSKHLLQNVCRQGNSRGFTNISWHKGQKRLTELPVEKTGLSIIGFMSISSRTEAILCSWKYKTACFNIWLFPQQAMRQQMSHCQTNSQQNCVFRLRSKLSEISNRIKRSKVSLQEIYKHFLSSNRSRIAAVNTWYVATPISMR